MVEEFLDELDKHQKGKTAYTYFVNTKKGNHSGDGLVHDLDLSVGV
jgi:predicted lipoprotein with Yx(FWY)xxD motif